MIIELTILNNIRNELTQTCTTDQCLKVLDQSDRLLRQKFYACAVCNVCSILSKICFICGIS